MYHTQARPVKSLPNTAITLAGPRGRREPSLMDSSLTVMRCYLAKVEWYEKINGDDRLTPFD